MHSDQDRLRDHLLSLRNLDANTIPVLIDIYLQLSDVQDDVESEYELFERIMMEIGQPAVPVLLDVLNNDEDPKRRSAAIDMLRMTALPGSMAGSPGDPQLTNAIRPHLNDDNKLVRDTALYTLATVGDDSIVPELVEALNTADNSTIRSMIVPALGRMKDERALSALIQLLEKEDAHDYIMIPNLIMALESIGTDEAIKAITDWRSGEAGRRYVETQAEMKVQRLNSLPDQLWYVEVNEHEPIQHMHNLHQAVSLLAVIKALRVASLSSRAERVLQEIGTPEALEALETWRQEQQG